MLNENQSEKSQCLKPATVTAASLSASAPSLTRRPFSGWLQVQVGGSPGGGPKPETHTQVHARAHLLCNCASTLRAASYPFAGVLLHARTVCRLGGGPGPPGASGGG